MQVAPNIFKAYDIRGLVDRELSPALAYALGRAFAEFLIKETSTPTPSSQLPIPLCVAVGEDMRPTSKEYAKELARGLSEGGVDVKMVGLVSTPAFYFSVGHLECDGGVMVSASHNPAEYNGFKVTRRQAIPVGGDSGLNILREMIEREDFGTPTRTGNIESVEGMPALSATAEIEYVTSPQSWGDRGGPTNMKRFKVVADSANGMGAQYLDEMFKAVDLDVTRMFWDFDGTFPNHDADPFKEENLHALQKAVVKQKADLGIATDGDGDRIFFVDENGKTIEPAIIRGLVSQVMLARHPKAKIGYDIRPGKITEDMIVDAGGVPLPMRVGHSLIKAAMRESGAIFAGESSGHFFFTFPIGVFEGPVAVALIVLSELSKSGKKFSEFVAPYRKYHHSKEINFKVKDTKQVIETVKKTFRDGELNELDGITITYPTYWFNVRASNTEPVVRLNLEAVDEATMMAKRDEISNLIKSL